MSPRDSMVRRSVWYSVADPARLAEYVPTGAVTYMIPSRNRRELPGPDSRPAEEKAKAIFELMTKLGIRYVLEPADSQPGAQFVRPVEEVFRDSGQGTCLDLCVAFSSAALDAGLHPMILTVTKSNTGNKSDKKCHSIVLIPRSRVWLASGRPEPVADSEVVHEPFLLDDMPLKAMVYRTATGSGDLLAIDMQQASRKPDGTPFGDWESAVSRGADFLTGTTGWDWDVCVDIGALRGTMVAPHSVYAPPRAQVLEPGYLKPAPGATRSPLQLIKARTGIVPFTGRDKLAKLTDWANKQPEEGREDLAVAVVTGVGGSGKTRLAAELCSNLEKNGWVAGFIPKTTKLSEAELIWFTRVESHLLLVLDYAEESHKEELTRLLRRLRERAATTRVVLTARSAGAWLDDLLEDDVLSGAMAQGLRRFELPRQAETSTKMAKRAAKRFAHHLETPEPTDVEIPQNSRWTTLDFVLHGWLIASEVDAASLPSSREGLYEEILRREIKYWQDEAKRQAMATVSEATLRTSAAVLSLIGPRTVSETADVLSRLPEWSEVELRKTYAELLSKMLADPGDAYVLRPDPVAEKLVVEVFVDDGETIDVPEELLDKVLPPDPLSDSRLNEATCPPAIARRALCHGRQSQQVCDVITRCTSQGDAPAAQLAHSALRCRTHLWISGLEAALKQGGPFVTALEEALKDGMNIPAAEIADSIPSRHSYLRGLAVTAMSRDQEKDMTPTERATYMNNLSNRLSEVGDREGALKAIREAVEIRRGLPEENKTAINPGLAGSLNNLSGCLFGVGDRGGALDAAREAVGIYRGLVEGNAEVFKSDLAMSLSNLSNRLSEVGDHEGALKAIREAVEIRCGLAEGNTAAFNPDLAGSLSNLSNRLFGVGDRGGALKAVREAVGIYRGLAKESPAAFSSELARSLSNLSNRLSEVGDRGGALEAVREAVEIYRGLAEKNPGAFETDLVRALNTLARILSDAGETDEALRCFIDETESFSTGLQARLWLARARWQGQAGGVNDLHHAVELADAQDDPRLLGRVRRAIAETASEWQTVIPAERWEKLPDWATYDLSEDLETLQAWIQCTNWDDYARMLNSSWPAPTEDDVALVRAAAERYIDVPEMCTLVDIVEAIAEQGLEPVLSEMQAIYEAGSLAGGWRTAHAERKGRQYLKKHQTMVGNPHCREVLQELSLPDEEREFLLALLDLATVSSVDLAYDVAEDLEDADDAIRDFIDTANVPGMYCVLRVRPDLTEATPHGRFAAALCAYLTGHPEEGKRYLDLIGTIATPDDRESFRRCVHTLGREPDYTDALAPVAEWLRTG